MMTKSFWDFNCLQAEAGTSCRRDEDPRWGRRTIIRLMNGAGTQWRASIDGRTVEDPRFAADSIEAELAGVEPDREAPPAPAELPTPAPARGGSDGDGQLVYSGKRYLAHDPACTWAAKIAAENLRTVAPAEALTCCGRGCLVCHPAVG